MYTITTNNKFIFHTHTYTNSQNILLIVKFVKQNNTFIMSSIFCILFPVFNTFSLISCNVVFGWTRLGMNLIQIYILHFYHNLQSIRDKSRHYFVDNFHFDWIHVFFDKFQVSKLVMYEEGVCMLFQIVGWVYVQCSKKPILLVNLFTLRGTVLMESKSN